MTGLDSLHVTLCFLGSQPVQEIDAIVSAVGAIAGRPPAALSLGEPVWLPPRRPRVVAVGVDDVGGALLELQAKLAAELERGGWYEREQRQFRPHVTVARTAGSGRISRLDLPVPAPIGFVGERVALMRSRSGRGGAQYERLIEVNLGPRQPL
jgi:2'-5' RNA ligase